ncbi:MAG: hypothetical protein WDO15_17625 [Bacteroidota bacterium]
MEVYGPLSFWIYIIVAIVFAVIRQMKKSAKQVGETPQKTSGDDNSPNKPMTFEELLREIQASKTPAPPQTPAPLPAKTTYKPVKSYDVDYDDDLEEEAKGLETIPTRKYDDSRSTELYEKAKKEAFYRPSLEETMKLSTTDMEFGHFKEYDAPSKRSIASEVLENFKDPEGFKKAFIMSEILKRKF